MRKIIITILLLTFLVISGCSKETKCPDTHPYEWGDGYCHKTPKCPENAPYYWSDGFCRNIQETKQDQTIPDNKIASQNKPNSEIQETPKTQIASNNQPIQEPITIDKNTNTDEKIIKRVIFDENNNQIPIDTKTFYVNKGYDIGYVIPEVIDTDFEDNSTVGDFSCEELLPKEMIITGNIANYESNGFVVWNYKLMNSHPQSKVNNHWTLPYLQLSTLSVYFTEPGTYSLDGGYCNTVEGKRYKVTKSTIKVETKKFEPYPTRKFSKYVLSKGEEVTVSYHVDKNWITTAEYLPLGWEPIDLEYWYPNNVKNRRVVLFSMSTGDVSIKLKAPDVEGNYIFEQGGASCGPEGDACWLGRDIIVVE